MRKCLSSVLFLFVFVCAGGIQPLRAASFPDPAPPNLTELGTKETPAPRTFDRLTFHAKPKRLHPEAKTSDWRRVLGPRDDATSSETHLLHNLPPGGPAKVWEVKKGQGYTSPAIE